MTQSVRKSRCNDCRSTVGTIPSGNTQWLLSTAIPLASDNAEERETTGFEETKKEPIQQLSILFSFASTDTLTL